MINGILHTIERFYLRHSELCWKGKVEHLGCERGLSLLYQGVHRIRSLALYNFVHVVELLLEALNLCWTPTDDAFFYLIWAGARWDRWAGTRIVVGPFRWLWTLDSSAKTRKKEDRRGLRPWPLRCLSQILPTEIKDQLIRGRMICVPFTDRVVWFL